VLLTNASKASVWSAVWLPWGGVQTIAGTFTLNERLPGQWFQSETGLHYNWHRHYDPTLGRYTQPDPLGFVDGPSVYGYVHARPLMGVDRDGRRERLPQSKPSTQICGTWCKAIIAGAIIVYEYCFGPKDDPPPPPQSFQEECKLRGKLPQPDGGVACVYACPTTKRQLVKILPAGEQCPETLFSK
jgi:RHS repeat-associated protein